VAKEAATGKAYLHSQTDISARPVIIVRAAKHLTGERAAAGTASREQEQGQQQQQQQL
jgi:hypothetical protein